MNNQDPKLIKDIIGRFHGKRFGGRVRKSFHLWLISPTDYTAKNEAMNEVWDNSPSSVTAAVYRSLETVKARLGMIPQRKQKPTMSLVTARIAAVMIPVAIALGAYFIYDGTPRNIEWARVEIPYGQTGHQLLADGTNVWLNAGSTLEYPVKFRGRLRDVKLNGEGFFDVAANKRKPFIVHTGYMHTEVVGTEFNICSYDDLQHEHITVLSGVVNVTTASNEVHTLTADRHLTHFKDSAQTEVSDVDAASMILWRENGLIFEGNTFEDILRTLERTFDITVVMDPAKFNGTLYRIRFSNGESLEYILEIVHQLVGYSYTYDDGVLTVGDELEKEPQKESRQR